MEPPVSYRREFFKSPHHGWLAALTLGVGFAVGHVVGLIAGAAAYAVGWIYLPDLGFFRRWVDARSAGTIAQQAQLELLEFSKRRESMIGGLGDHQRKRYSSLAAVCAEIEKAGSVETAGSASALNEPQLRRLDDLMWTYLKMLAIEESIIRFLAGEDEEDLPGLLRQTESEMKQLEIEDAGRQSDAVRQSRKRLLQSKNERLLVVQKRLEKSEQARANLDLVRAEQDRLEHQIKLVRADAVASRNTASLSTRINATVEQLDQTNRWISEMEEFKDLVGEMPSSGIRVGYQAPGSSTQEETRPARPAGRTGQ